MKAPELLFGRKLPKRTPERLQIRIGASFQDDLTGLETIVPNYFFDFLLPPDFFLPEDLEAEDFFEEPPLDFVAEDFVDPPLDFFAEGEFPPFLCFWTWAGAALTLGVGVGVGVLDTLKLVVTSVAAL